MNNPISIEAFINAPIEKVWRDFTSPEAIMKWNHASEDWHCPHAENDLRVGGRFLSRMEAKDGSVEFDFTGTYTDVTPHERIAYAMDDERKVDMTFTPVGSGVKITGMFEPESENPHEMQKGGWQAILDNFKAYTESH